MSSAAALLPLSDPQRLAADPARLVWLGASAGTGKTQVLAARVLRLLLSGAAPASILCITYTKAGAAEMARRIHDRLALWVRSSDAAIASDLLALDPVPPSPALIARARTLFAAVIDSVHGAVRVMTIHSFCQSLLATFPIEAGMAPGFRLIEEEEAAANRRVILNQLFAAPGASGDLRRGRAAALAQRLSLGAARSFLDRAIAACDGPAAPPMPPDAAAVRRALDLPAGPPEAWALAALAPGVFPDALAAEIGAAARAMGGRTGEDIADAAEPWAGLDAAARAVHLPALRKQLLTTKDELRAPYQPGKKLADVGAAAAALAGAIDALTATSAGMALADDLAAGWSLAADLAAEWRAHKTAHGLAEFHDIIARAALLLGTGPGGGAPFADWVRFKLDQQIDHILVDEAQDSNAAQWDIVWGLSEEFFAGQAAREGRPSSLFTVGDRKQAIFGFQGTDPAAFAAARTRFADAGQAAQRPLIPADLATNYRSAPAILALVDRWIADGAGAAMGLDGAIPLHQPHKRQTAGRVECWGPLVVGARAGDSGDGDSGGGGGGDDPGGDGGDDPPTGGASGPATDTASVMLARALADQIADWLDHGHDGRAVAPGDILILVRTRKDLVARIIAQLAARRVPVAGIDRLDLKASLAVQDLLSVVRFAVQPGDDLALAEILVSPLLGWSQQQMADAAAARRGQSLWQWLRRPDAGPAETAAAAVLLGWLARADYAPPSEFLAEILAGAQRGRRRLLARLGPAADDSIAALLTSARAYEQRGGASLVGFLAALDAGSAVIKRRSDPSGMVRVMTVHGAKGLQAPIVILADAADVPRPDRADVKLTIGAHRDLPLFAVPRGARAAGLKAAVDRAVAAQMAEYWRLGYVALTRPERMLVVTGTVKMAKQEPKPVAEQSWFASASRAMAAIAATADPVPDPRWGARRVLANAPGRWADDGGARTATPAPRRARPAAAPPIWADTPPPAEARPPRPLAPSGLGHDDAATAPVLAGQNSARGWAAQRGAAMHGLFQYLPALPADQRGAVGAAWLARQLPGAPAAQRAEMLDEVLAILADPAFAALFSADSLAEVPFSAVVPGGQVIAGSVDRLVIAADGVAVVDYKTGQFVPASAAQVQPAYMRQMAAYVAALEVIFPGQPVRAALLYTAAPRLIWLDAAALTAYRPDSR